MTHFSFVKRRSNFYGLTIKGIIALQKTFMEVHPNFEEEAPFYSLNQTYLVNDYTFGTFNDVIQILANHFNLTLDLYKQKKQVWGNVYKDRNGTIITNGIVGDVFAKQVDIAVASLSMTPQRVDYISFLNPISPEILSIAIPAHAVYESPDFDVFLKPFHWPLWIAVLVATFIIAIAKLLTDDTRSFDIAKFCEHVWASFKAFFGGTDGHLMDTRKSSNRVVLLSSMLGGLVIWLSYNGYLTADLLAIENRYPFNDLESLSKSNWRYNFRLPKLKD